MPKHELGAKSAAVRQYLAEHLDAGPKEVVTALKEKGMTVTEALVSKIKYGKSAGAKKMRRKGAAGGKRSRNGATSRSELIRQYMTRHPGAKAREIHEGLRQEGVKVSMGLVSFVKSTFGKKRSGRAVASVAARKTSPSSVTIEQLIELKRLTNTLGGASQVRQALDTLDQLQ